MRTIDDVIAALPRPKMMQLPAPAYSGPPDTWLGEDRRPRIGLAVESMRRHTTDEGWQLFQALEASRQYHLVAGGFDGMTRNENGAIRMGGTCVPAILAHFDPSVVILQDKREWEGRTAGGPAGFDPRERFTNVETLAARPDVFKLTVLKDAQHDPEYNRRAAEEISCHAWIVYYHPRIVAHLAPYVRPQHLVRTWHTVDRELVPAFDAFPRADQAVLSGAVSAAYPLRTRMLMAWRRGEFGDKVHMVWHPGYNRNGCHTPAYLKQLSTFKVAICTSSVYGYALRKIVEATACGCLVITDLPVDERMPEIESNILRIDPGMPLPQIKALIDELIQVWSPGVQRAAAERAKAFYDYRAMGARLAADIETMRRSYNG